MELDMQDTLPKEKYSILYGKLSIRDHQLLANHQTS